jgi:hypothetical protein
MELKYVENELDALDLVLLPLNALHPDHTSYNILLNQYKGVLKATSDFVGNSDGTHALAVNKFVEFAKIAKDKNYDLALCPEYSCPWDSLAQLHNSSLVPNNSKLWVFGMESMTPAQLIAFTTTNNKIIWIYDRELCGRAHEKKFLDPVCLLFKAKSKSSDTESVVCVVQFKTSHMSVHNDKYREADYLIEGKYIYVLKNPDSSIYLATLICSDSLIFNLKLLSDKNLDKVLLLHIQMNLEPRHTAFKKYRDEIFSNGEIDKIEVLCLNWAKDSEVLTHKIKYSGTAYFYKPAKPITEDNRLDENQKHGIFYSYWKNNRCHTAFFDSDEMLIGFQTDKTWQVLSATQLQRRKGPIGYENHMWDENKYLLVTPLPDKFKMHCDGLLCDLSPLDGLGHTNQERLIKLSSGQNIRKDSFEVSSFDFFKIDDNEYVNRVTYTQEPDATIALTKLDYLMKLKELVGIFKNGALFPQELVSLSENSKIFYSYSDSPFVNVFSEDNKAIGTMAYIGPSLEVTAKSTYDNLNKLYLESIGESQRGREMPKIIIWYQDGTLKKYFLPNVNIVKNFETDNTSIDKD